MEEKQTFEYKYVAPTPKERREIESIKRRYAPEVKAADPLARLKALDNKVAGTAQALALSVGVVGTLIFGLGLSMVLEFNLLLWGIAVAVLGVAVLLSAYPTYSLFLARGKKKYGEEILRLTDALLGETEKAPAPTVSETEQADAPAKGEAAENAAAPTLGNAEEHPAPNETEQEK